MEDKFMQRFDENGNFVNLSIEEKNEDFEVEQSLNNFSVPKPLSKF